MIANRSYPIEKPLEGLESFYQEFLTNRLKEFQELQGALGSKDFKAIAEMAHKWKGFCEPYGFGQLGIIARELEEMAKANEAKKCSDLLGDVEHYLAHKKTTSP